MLGHARMLLGGCPWELMHGWVTQDPPVVHVQILNMAFILVGTAEGVKRVFQTGSPLSTTGLQSIPLFALTNGRRGMCRAINHTP